MRTLTDEMRKMAEERLAAVAHAVCEAHGAEAHVHWKRGYPVTVNHDAETDVAVDAAEAITGDGTVEIRVSPTMGGEDFSYMLNARPGAMILIGNGDSAGLHHPEYDFNDQIIPAGISYWAKLAEMNPAR